MKIKICEKELEYEWYDEQYKIAKEEVKCIYFVIITHMLESIYIIIISDYHDNTRGIIKVARSQRYAYEEAFTKNGYPVLYSCLLA